MLVLPAWYPSARQPLAGPFVRDHARAAAVYGHRMVVLADEGPVLSGGSLVQLTEERDGPLRVFRLSYRPRTGTLLYLPAVLRLARRLARQGTPVDLIHAHVHRMAWPAAIAGALLRRPFVVTEHSSEWPGRTISRGALRRARIAFPRAALVSPVNERLRRAIEGYGIRTRFRVVPNAVDSALFYPAEEPPAVPATRLVNVALHREGKGLDGLLRAFAALVERHPELELELIGEGPQTPDLHRLTEELGVSQRVTFSGRARPEEIAEALRRSHVFVFPSLGENMPLAVLEALCCGLPVAATDVGGIPEAVGGDGALAPPGDACAFAAAVESILERYQNLDRHAIAARAAARWSLDAVGGTWDEIYRAVPARQRPR